MIVNNYVVIVSVAYKHLKNLFILFYLLFFYLERVHQSSHGSYRT